MRFVTGLGAKRLWRESSAGDGMDRSRTLPFDRHRVGDPPRSTAGSPPCGEGDETVTAIATPPEQAAPPAEITNEPPAAKRRDDRQAAAILTCHDLRKSFGERKAVDGVGFAIRAGETYGLLGPNGAGKTTTISMICGILPADGGEVRVAGVKVDTGTVAAKGAIGYVPQDLAIYPDLSARENLTFFGRLYGLRGSQLRDRIAEVLAIIDLVDRADERTERFSGGMKRRLNIGIGLLHRPRLLVLDEPTVGVDPQSRNAILASVEAPERRRAWASCTRPTTWKRPSACATGSASSTTAGSSRRGRAANSSPSSAGRQDQAERDRRPGAGAAAARQIAGVRDATPHDGGIDLLVVEARRLLPRPRAMTQDGVSIRSVEVVEPDLEAVFLHLTGKALRD